MCGHLINTGFITRTIGIYYTNYLKTDKKRGCSAMPSFYRFHIASVNNFPIA